jgi:hypothetical protein
VVSVSCIKVTDLKTAEERRNRQFVKKRLGIARRTPQLPLRKKRDMRIRNSETRNSAFISAIETLGCRARTLSQQSFAVFYYFR